MSLYTSIFLLFAAFAVLANAQCTPRTAADWNTGYTALTWYFGTNEGEGSTLYQWSLNNGYFSNADLSLSSSDASLIYSSYPMINEAPIMGGKNLTIGAYDKFIPTANFICLGDGMGMWGPSYPDFTEGRGYVRSRHPNLEVYVHYSAPNDTSYIRTIYYVKNIGATPERARFRTLTWANAWAADLSPFNERRYYTGNTYEAGDKGLNGDSPTPDYRPYSIHARGKNSLDKTAIVYGEMVNWVVGTSYTAVLGPSQEFAYMQIFSFGKNLTNALKNAAEIDAEPAYIFHDLTADQLAMIRNWGGCQVIIGPTATVTVTPPAQCSTTGLTSDFTVQASSSRTDLTADFTHRVVGIQNIELVTYQSSTTLSVPNGAGAVRHQLWYKECLVRETPFNACARS